MLVFYKERLALLSVPKTGSTAFQQALGNRADIVISGPPDLKHATVRRFDRFFQTMFDKMFDTEMEIMAVVRDPIDWLGSWYRYRSRAERDGHKNSTKNMDFDAFVRAYMKNPRPEIADVGTQTEFFQPRRNRPGATHIYKYENQSGILDFLQDRLNCDINLQRVNESPNRPLHLAAETEQLFGVKFAAEFGLHAAAK